MFINKHFTYLPCAYLKKVKDDIYKILGILFLCEDEYAGKFSKSALVYIPLNAKPSKWSNTLRQFVTNLPTNCLSVFDHFGGLML